MQKFVPRGGGHEKLYHVLEGGGGAHEVFFTLSWQSGGGGVQIFSDP